ncbi:MAG TPA: sigma-70 family RNA polymerase sigma factor [Thermoleophilaceae bacterium]|nr:sigma-70 family RNA polymerase sigma factor [Thermoleophilaceae bacterium]
MERTARAPAAARAPVRGPKRLLALRSDVGLVDLVRAGDAAAFEVLYERHVAGLLGFCRHMLGSQQEAEDAVQQAFVSAHDALHRGTGEIAFKPWLYTIARNRCVSVLRARREQPAELPELSTAGLNEQVERRADLRELVRDVQRLPERQRAALVLSELGDLSHAEVAEVIGDEPQAVKGLVFRARAALSERRDARAADCGEIRMELAAATGGGLRRGRLRYHLDSCSGCSAYLDEVRRQRKLLGLALPVAAAPALKDAVMSGVGIGGGAAGMAASGGAGLAGGAAGAGAMGATASGGAATVGGTLLGGAAVKLAVAGVVLAGGAGLATEAVRDDGGVPADRAPAATDDGVPAGTADGRAAPAASGIPSDRALKRRQGKRGAERRALGQQRASERSGGRSAAGERSGKALGRRGGAPARLNGRQGGQAERVKPGRHTQPRPAGQRGESRGDRAADPVGPLGAEAPGGGRPSSDAPRSTPPQAPSPRTPLPASPGPSNREAPPATGGGRDASELVGPSP